MTAAMFQQSALEKDIKSSIRKYLRWKGWKVVYNLQGLASEKGIADTTIIKNGRVIMLETKTRKGFQRPKQKDFQKDWEAHGGEYMIVRSIDDVQKAGL